MLSSSKVTLEQAMKIQAVLLRGMARKITCWQAGEILGLATGIWVACGNTAYRGFRPTEQPNPNRQVLNANG